MLYDWTKQELGLADVKDANGERYSHVVRVDTDTGVLSVWKTSSGVVLMPNGKPMRARFRVPAPVTVEFI